MEDNELFCFGVWCGDIRRPYGGINKSNFAYLLITIFVNNLYLPPLKKKKKPKISSD